MYAAKRTLEKNPNEKVLILEVENTYFNRGSYINQARLHNGYHYPRSYSTASKSAKYFDRFYNDFKEGINDNFKKVYAVAADYSWANGEQFKKFCDNLNLLCDEIPKENFFNPHTIDKAFLTKEYSFDAKKIGDKLYRELRALGCNFKFEAKITSIKKEKDIFIVQLEDGSEYFTPFILNATYAGINKIHDLLGFEYLPIKYEFCEVILCEVSDNIKNDHLPPYDCSGDEKLHTKEHRKGCIHCGIYPETAFQEMVQTAKKYLSEDIEIKYVKSLFTIKPILVASEIDDSRPTIIRQYSQNPDFYTVFSGKINTMYDLDEIL